MKKRNVLVTIASGGEEIETVTIVDVLRRAGANVTLAKVGTDSNGANLDCQMSRGVTLKADASLTDMSVLQTKYDAIVIPGGLEGATAMAKDKNLFNMIEE